MSRHGGFSEERTESLFGLFSGFIDGRDGKELFDTFKPKLDGLTPLEVLVMGERLLKAGYSVENIKKQVEKVFNIIIPALKEYEWTEPDKESAVCWLMEENRALAAHMDGMKGKIRELSSLEPSSVAYSSVYSSLKKDFRRLAEFEPHYLKTENVLFPFLEKHQYFEQPLKIIWSLDDDIRTVIKEVNSALDSADSLGIEEHVIIGRLFMLMMRMTYKENLVILPAAAECLSGAENTRMLSMFGEIGFAFVEPPACSSGSEEQAEYTGGLIKMGETGVLTVSQLVSMLNSLPVDITFVDENDQVRYFSSPKERFFTRSPAIIGRKVQNCHPPDSIDTVNRIVESFRSGSKSEAKFWINLRGRLLLISYYAVRDGKGHYMGTVEATQDITEIKELQGERRLLEWDQD
ncbi:DUF438 domain-containing protein [Geovibrio thiophilus]|uniref:DUF438 domain-containing protein n=1 Tax=Geovibrio thiophilus TaxID=139438 RepID=A0A410JWC4_9BACT|nr:PAS domain-containing protein [Geovibrio thiophilus]QAR32453.1 DUF438 domain-containing protein [Geovibrio thiophilus]